MENSAKARGMATGSIRLRMQSTKATGRMVNKRAREELTIAMETITRVIGKTDVSKDRVNMRSIRTAPMKVIFLTASTTVLAPSLTQTKINMKASSRTARSMEKVNTTGLTETTTTDNGRTTAQKARAPA